MRRLPDTLHTVVGIAFTSILVLVAVGIGLVALAVVRRLYRGQA